MVTMKTHVNRTFGRVFRSEAGALRCFTDGMIDLAKLADATQAYLTGQIHASQTGLLEDFAAEGAAAVAAYAPLLDIAYGGHEREVFDLFVSPEPWRGTVAYFHAGYWQGRDKAQFRFIAAPFMAAGVDVTLVNYPLCPEVSLRRLMGSAAASIPKILGKVRGMGRGGERLVAAGHSAGGHIAVELALAGAAVSAVIAISGIYELAPLRATRLNDKLGLDAEEARAMSPLHRVGGVLPPALFMVGGLETPEFRGQSEAMHEAWGAAGRSTYLEIEGADHFSVLRAFGPGVWEVGEGGYFFEKK
jgi:arylformamidase